MNYLKGEDVYKRQEKLPPEKKIGKILIGEFKNEARPEYTEEYEKLIKRLKEEV